MTDETSLDLEEVSSQEADDDSEFDSATYNIKTYGSDFTLELLIHKLQDGEITVPSFQRKYVWSQKKASKLIESFLLGLPVPQIFLYRKQENQDLLVVDGQQRLRTVQQFFGGKFDDGTVFDLRGVKPQWQNKTFVDLSELDKRKIRNYILRATIFEQLDPQDDSSIFEIFERLNTGGMALNSQEIRNCVVHGSINSFLKTINQIKIWRVLLNKPEEDDRMKDIEMIIRFFALHENWKSYKKPMSTFITDYMKRNKNISKEEQDFLETLFTQVVNKIHNDIGKGAFSLKQSGINVAVFDSLTVAIATIGVDKIPDLREKFDRLRINPEYVKAVSAATTDDERVKGRIDIAIRILNNEII